MGISTSDVLTLREVALRLARLPGSSAKKIYDAKLLSLLKSGDLAAGIFFPGHLVLWIAIPKTHWARVSSARFRSIRLSADRRGIYTVRITQLLDEYKQAVSLGLDQSSDLKASLLAELGVALSSAKYRFEVYIPKSEWDQYLQRNDINEPVPAIMANLGRPPKSGWRKLVVIVGAYLIKHYETTAEPIKVELAAQQIHAIATAEGIADLPGEPTIKDALTKIKEKARAISI